MLTYSEKNTSWVYISLWRTVMCPQVKKTLLWNEPITDQQTASSRDKYHATNISIAVKLSPQ